MRLAPVPGPEITPKSFLTAPWHSWFSQLWQFVNAPSFTAPPQLPSYTVATLPAPTAGAMAFVTDATATAITGLGLVAAGGGANKVPVYGDGAAWRIL